MLLTVLFLSACSNSAQPKEENDVQSIKDVTVKIRNYIHFLKKNETINEDEMRKI